MALHGGAPKKGETIMKRLTLMLLGLVTAAAIAGAVSAQSTDPGAAAQGSGQANGQAKAQPKPETSTPPPAYTPPVSTVPPATVEAAGKANAGAAATPRPNPALDAARTKAKKAPAKEREEVEKKISASVNEVEAEASAKGDATVAGRIAAEFGMTTDAIVAERSQYGRGWGELMIAHTLAANGTSGLTVADILELRAEGMGWGQIAHGMDLKLGEVASAVRAEAKVATGLAKADGKPAMIRGVKAGAAAGAQTSAKAGRGKEAGAPASVGVGVGAGTTIEKGHGGK
jgi:hypothetical protein